MHYSAMPSGEGGMCVWVVSWLLVVVGGCLWLLVVGGCWWMVQKSTNTMHQYGAPTRSNNILFEAKMLLQMCPKKACLLGTEILRICLQIFLQIFDVCFANGFANGFANVHGYFANSFANCH